MFPRVSLCDQTYELFCITYHLLHDATFSSLNCLHPVEAVEQLHEQLQQGPSEADQDIADVLRQAEDYLRQIKDVDFGAKEVNAYDSLE